MLELTLTLTREEIEDMCRRVEAHAMLLPRQSERADVRLLVAAMRAAVQQGFPVDPITVRRDGP